MHRAIKKTKKEETLLWQSGHLPRVRLLQSSGGCSKCQVPSKSIKLNGFQDVAGRNLPYVIASTACTTVSRDKATK